MSKFWKFMNKFEIFEGFYNRQIVVYGCMIIYNQNAT